MKDTITPALSMQEKSYTVMGDLSVGIRINHNPYSIPLERVFSLAARNNPRRSYLFVSKLIGKHIPVHPRIPLLTGFLLASRLAENLGIDVDGNKINEAVAMIAGHGNCNLMRAAYSFPGKTLFIGFAETATALGHSVFDSFSGDIGFLHTTRESLAGTCDTIYFTEEHCHAPEQRCLVNDASFFTGNNLLVLIDDEITSGNTCLNFIKRIQKKYPQQNYVVLTILDWRSGEAQKKYVRAEQELGIKINVISLCAGDFWSRGGSPTVTGLLPGTATSSPEIPDIVNIIAPVGPEIEIQSGGGKAAGYLKYTGRFGLGAGDEGPLFSLAEALGQRLGALRKGRKTLCLGTGEFMYIPFLTACHMGEGVMVQSTTRSPVHPHGGRDYAVKHAIAFEDPFIPGINNFVYNIPPYYYDEVFVFWEREVKPELVAPLAGSLHSLGIGHIVFIVCCRS
jgi:hypothetical protein